MLLAVAAVACAGDTDVELEEKAAIAEATSDSAIMVDCSEIPISGDGFGGAYLNCADRLSLYALFSCYPMARETVEARCPEWEGLHDDTIDWARVAELIGEEGARQEAKMLELEKKLEERYPDAESEAPPEEP